MKSMEGPMKQEERDPNYYRKVTVFDLERSNIPLRLLGHIGPEHILEIDREKMSQFLGVWSNNLENNLEHGLLFYHPSDIDSILPDAYMAHLLVGAMNRRRSVYCVSMFELDALEFGDPGFVDFLINVEVLGIYDFPYVSDKIIPILNRIFSRRYDHLLPTLYSSHEKNLPETVMNSYYGELHRSAVQALKNFTVYFEIGSKHE